MKIHEMFHLNTAYLDRDVGIEIEVEGCDLPLSDLGNWVYTHDHSLRGESAEYVLYQPLTIGEGTKAVDFLYKRLKGKVNKSVRAGVHVHLNVLDFTPRQLFTFVTTYMLFEPLLYQFCSDSRKYNPFCLASSDAEYFTYKVRQAITDKNLRALVDDNLRYSGLNLNPIAKFGSVEFRQLETPTNFTKIKLWATLLHHMKLWSLTKADPFDVVKSFERDGIDIVRRAFKHNFKHLLVDGAEGMLRDGCKQAYNVVTAVNWSRYNFGDEPEVSEKLTRTTTSMERARMMADEWSTAWDSMAFRPIPVPTQEEIDQSEEEERSREHRVEWALDLRNGESILNIDSWFGQCRAVISQDNLPDGLTVSDITHFLSDERALEHVYHGRQYLRYNATLRVFYLAGSPEGGPDTFCIAKIEEV